MNLDKAQFAEKILRFCTLYNNKYRSGHQQHVVRKTTSKSCFCVMRNKKYQYLMKNNGKMAKRTEYMVYFCMHIKSPQR